MFTSVLANKIPAGQPFSRQVWRQDPPFYLEAAGRTKLLYRSQSSGDHQFSLPPLLNFVIDSFHCATVSGTYMLLTIQNTSY